jgi:hypothetical protein
LTGGAIGADAGHGLAKAHAAFAGLQELSILSSARQASRGLLGEVGEGHHRPFLANDMPSPRMEPPVKLILRGLAGGARKRGFQPDSPIDFLLQSADVNQTAFNLFEPIHHEIILPDVYVRLWHVDGTFMASESLLSDHSTHQ